MAEATALTDAPALRSERMCDFQSMAPFLQDPVGGCQQDSVTGLCDHGGMKTVGERVKAEREAQGITRGALSQMTGVGYSTLAELENGRMQTTTKLRVIAEALGVSLQYLETGEGPRTGPASQPVGLDVAKLTDLLATVEAATEKAGVRLPPRVKARLVASLYADREASAAASAQAVQAALVSILATMETTNEPDAAR